MRRARPKNWKRHQHYKGRRPPWIKLHRALIDDPAWGRLQLASKALAPQLWLLASESDTGEIDLDADAIAWRLRCSAEDVRPALDELLAQGWLEITGACDDRLQDASTMLAERLQGASDLPPQSQSQSQRSESDQSQRQTAIQSPRNESRKPKNQTPSEPRNEPAQRLIETAKQLEQWGFSQYGQLTGTNWSKLRSMLPADRDELAAAAATGGNSWGYLAKVLASMREKASEPTPAAKPKRKARHPAIELALAHHAAGKCSLAPDAHDEPEIVRRAEAPGGIDWALLETANREPDCTDGYWETLWRVYDRLKNAPVAHGKWPRIDAGETNGLGNPGTPKTRHSGEVEAIHDA